MQTIPASTKALADSLACITLRAYVDGTQLDASIVSCVHTASVCGGDSFSIGNACAAEVELALAEVSKVLYGAKLHLTWDVDGVEYPLFSGTVDSATTADDQATVTAYDAMYLAGSATYTPSASVLSACTAADVLEDIATQMGVNLGAETRTAAEAVPLTDGVANLDSDTTCAAAAGIVAALMGGNAIISREGELIVKGYSTADFSTRSYSGGAQPEDMDFELSGLTFRRTDTATTENEDGSQSEETTTTDYTATDGVGGIVIENPLATQALVDGAFSRLSGLTFRPGQYDLPGGIEVEPGDLIQVDGVTVAVMTVSLSLDGGCKASVASLGRPKENGAIGPVNRALSALSSEIARAKQIIAENAIITNANIGNLRAEMITAEELDVVKADIDDLKATDAELQNAIIGKADIADLNAANAEIENLKATDAELQNAIIGKADIADLNVTNANIETLEADVANINNVLAGNVGTGNLQAVHITSDNVVIDDATITDAMIANLSAGKLTAGTIYTSLVKIASDEDENLLIDGSTIQIKDSNGTVRVQIGKDGNGDYSYYLWDADGNLMWSPTGVTEAGLNPGIIKDVNVAEDAAISGSKLDITSVAEKLNEDGSVVVDAANVTIDNTTLDVQFKTVTQKTEENTAALDALQSDSVADITPYYAVGTSPDEPPSAPGSTGGTGRAAALVGTAVVGESIVGDEVGLTGEWTTVQPTAGDGEYLWVAYRVEYLDGSIKWTAPALLTDTTLREKTTTLQTELSVVQGQIESKVWQTDIEEAQSQLQTQITDLGTSVTQTAEEIAQEATKNTVTQDEFALYQETVSSSFTQQADSFELKITESVGSIQEQTDANTDTLETVTHSIKFTADGNVDLYAINLRFVDDAGEVVAYWDMDTLHTGNIYVDTSERAQFGNFAFQPRSDGSLVFLKVGG